jgi:6-pyruvoyltetrahydropterin/6-carboxytetrahydropterin synthase
MDVREWLSHAGGKYAITKTFTDAEGLSAVFRQWRADSHCALLHGYALQVKVMLSCDSKDLDAKNWVYDFGNFKEFKAWLKDTFDHKCLVAEDDPMLHWFKDAHKMRMMDIVIVPATGCEAFSRYVYSWLRSSLDAYVGFGRRVNIEFVEVREHGGNSGLYVPDDSSLVSLEELKALRADVKSLLTHIEQAGGIECLPSNSG